MTNQIGVGRWYFKTITPVVNIKLYSCCDWAGALVNLRDLIHVDGREVLLMMSLPSSTKG